MNKVYGLSTLILCILAIFIRQQYVNQSLAEPCCVTNVKSNSSLERIINVTNGITKQMLTYRKRLIPYTPKFSLHANNHLLKYGDTQEIYLRNNQLHIQYTYNFLHGYKTGTKSIIFEIPEDMTSCTITFNWDQDSRIIIKDAQVITITA